jgi:protein-S-isoprenylcysteine O-methyltransferase
LISPLGVWLLAVGYLIVAAFLIAQMLLRPTEPAKTLRREKFDRGSTLLIGFVLAASLLLPLVAGILNIATFSISLVEGLTSVAFMLLGLGLRIWAAVVLGEFYTGTLMTIEGHRVVSTGPYGRIRHPGYLGSILLWCGFGVLSSSLLVAVLLPVMLVAVYTYRISAEEHMLVQELGDDYVQYQRRTRRLIPFVY